MSARRLRIEDMIEAMLRNRVNPSTIERILSDLGLPEDKIKQALAKYEIRQVEQQEEQEANVTTYPQHTVIHGRHFEEDTISNIVNKLGERISELESRINRMELKLRSGNATSHIGQIEKRLRQLEVEFKAFRNALLQIIPELRKALREVLQSEEQTTIR